MYNKRDSLTTRHKETPEELTYRKKINQLIAQSVTNSFSQNSMCYRNHLSF